MPSMHWPYALCNSSSMRPAVSADQISRRMLNRRRRRCSMRSFPRQAVRHPSDGVSSSDVVTWGTALSSLILYGSPAGLPEQNIHLNMWNYNKLEFIIKRSKDRSIFSLHVDLHHSDEQFYLFFCLLLWRKTVIICLILLVLFIQKFAQKSNVGLYYGNMF